MPQAPQADSQSFESDAEKFQSFRERIFTDLYPIAGDLAARYAKIAERFNYEQANREIIKIHERLHIHDLNLCGSMEDLKQAAKLHAEECLSIRGCCLSPFETYLECKKLVERYGIAPPLAKEGYEPAINRMCCRRWWFRKIRILSLRSLEAVARDIELVSRVRSSYASDYTVKLKKQQKDKNRLYLESSFITIDSAIK